MAHIIAALFDISVPKLTVQRAFYATAKQDLGLLKTILVGLSIGEINSITDEYKNTLLHIATSTKDVHTVKYLLERGMNKHRENSFKETPWIKAVQTQNQDLIQTFIDTEKTVLCEYKKIADRCKDEIKVLQETTNRLSFENDTNKKQIALSNGVNKRLREENDDLKRNNIELQTKNKQLKTSVDNLMAGMRK